MSKTAELTKDELSLLLYLECRAVDYAGRVNQEHVNADDRKVMERWNKSGFVESGRIILDDVTRDGSLWCKLSFDALITAHTERVKRARQMWEKRTYTTTAEKRSAV